jgi:hypothetical protein
MISVHITSFWHWFSRFSDVYRQLHRLPIESADFWENQLLTQLNTVQRWPWQVVFEWHINGTTEMIFTAKRQLYYFPIIEQLVSGAPPLPGWNFQALYPPREPGHNISERFGHTCISPHELWLAPSSVKQVGGGKYLLDIYAELYDPAEIIHRKAIDAVLFNILGERSMVIDIAGFEVKWVFCLSPEEKNKLSPLKKLPAIMHYGKHPQPNSDRPQVGQ